MTRTRVLVRTYWSEPVPLPAPAEAARLRARPEGIAKQLALCLQALKPFSYPISPCTQRNGLAIVRNSPRTIAFPFVGCASICKYHRVGRFEADGLFKVGHGTVEVAPMNIASSAMHVGPRTVLIELDCSIGISKGAVKILLVGVRITSGFVCISILRIQLNCLTVVRYRAIIVFFTV